MSTSVIEIPPPKGICPPTHLFESNPRNKTILNVQESGFVGILCRMRAHSVNESVCSYNI